MTLIRPGEGRRAFIPGGAELIEHRDFLFDDRKMSRDLLLAIEDIVPVLLEQRPAFFSGGISFALQRCEGLERAQRHPCFSQADQQPDPTVILLAKPAVTARSAWNSLQ